MRFGLLVIFTFSVFLFSAQTSVLTGFRNSSWLLLDTNGNVLTKTDYHYIHSFDQKNTSYFMQNGLYGIIGNDGKERLKAEYVDIVQHGFGIYSVRKDDSWQLVRVLDQNPQIIIDTLEQLPEVLGSNWIIFNDSLINRIVNLQSGKTIPKNKKAIVRLNSAEYLAMVQDSIITAYDPKGQPIKRIVGELFYFEDFLILRDTAESLTILDKDGIWSLPFEVEYFNVHFNTVFFGNERTGILYDIRTKEVLFQGPYSYIHIENEEYFYVEGENGTNLIDRRTKKALLPEKLNYFFEDENFYYAYHQNQTMALINKDGKFVVPGWYDDIQLNGDLASMSLTGNYGLYSLKKKSFILPMIYSAVSNQKKNRYKAVSDDAFTIIEINDKHDIVKRIDGSNSIKVRTASGRRKISIDPRLFSLGWYVDSTEFEHKGEMKMRYRWGLKDSTDSIIMKPRYLDLKYISGPFSLQVNPLKKIEMPGEKIEEHITYEFVEWDKGTKLPGPVCLYVDSNDFESQNWTRFSTPKAVGIIDAQSKIRYFTYLSGRSIPFTRYCDAENFHPSPKETDTSYYQVDYQFHPYDYVADDNRFVVSNAKWNFIQPNGTDLFPEPFQFVQEFVGSTAIAKKNDKWGVITKDSVLIPFKFKKITRKIIGEDTLFITDESPDATRYLDPDLKNIVGIKNVIAKSENIFLVERKTSQDLMNDEGEVLIQNVRSVKKLPSGYFKTKVEKEIQILDSSGRNVASTSFEVTDVLMDNYLLTEKSGKYGLTDFSDKLLLPENNNSIKSSGSYIIAHSDMFYLFNDNLELILKSPNPIHIDPFTAQIAITKKNKTFIYSGNQKLATLKKLKPFNYLNGLIWTTSDEHSFGISSKGDTVIKSSEIESFEKLPNGWLALKLKDGPVNFYKADWTPISTPVVSKKFQYLDKNYLAFYNKKSRWLIWNGETQKQIEVDQIIGNYENDLCLVRTGKSYYYITRDLEPANKLRYTGASPFHKGNAAVCDNRGGTLIDTNFRFLSYPSYTGLTYAGANMYKAAPQVLHNIYRLNGTSVLSKSVEKISFINNRIIQTIDHGELHYLRLSGELMF